MSSELKLQVSYEDLKRLFDADDAPSIRFKTAMANEFASKHLKSIISTYVENNVSGLVRKEVDRYIDLAYTETDPLTKKKVLPIDLRDMIALEINRQIDDYVREQVQALAGQRIEERLSKVSLDDLINTAVSKRVVQITNALCPIPTRT